MIIKKVLNDLVIYCKTPGSQNDQNDWKNEQNTQILHTEIIRLRMKDNLSIVAIAEIVNKSKSVVHDILKVYNDYGSSEARKSTGRPRITTKKEDRAMVKLDKKDRFKTAAAVSREIIFFFFTDITR